MSSKREIINENYPGVACMDDFDDCIIGICSRFGQEDIVAYNVDKVIDKLTTAHGMSVEEAFEYYEFNQIGGWVGDTTPCFIDTLNEDGLV